MSGIEKVGLDGSICWLSVVWCYFYPRDVCQELIYFIQQTTVRLVILIQEGSLNRMVRRFSDFQERVLESRKVLQASLRLKDIQPGTSNTRHQLS